MMLLSLWVGKGHPEMNNFLWPLVRQLKIAESTGYRIFNELNVVIQVRVVVILFTADLRAKV